jgi:peptidoglycan hydrolase CwlO-like protein
MKKAMATMLLTLIFLSYGSSTCKAAACDNTGVSKISAASPNTSIQNDLDELNSEIKELADRVNTVNLPEQGRSSKSNFSPSVWPSIN